MNKGGGRALAALSLYLPGLAAVRRGEDSAELADRPALALVDKMHAMERQRLAGFLELPARAAVCRVQQHRPRPAYDPRLRADRANRVQIQARANLFGQFMPSEAPRVAPARAR